MSDLSPSNASLKYIPGLDGLRAFSVLLVIFFHFIAPFASRLEVGDPIGQFLSVVARVGWVGVDIFFVISGYLIAKIWSGKKMTLSQGGVRNGGYASFLIRRARRLLPAYIVCVCAFFVVALFLSPGSKVLGNLHLLLTMTSNIESSFGDRHALSDNLFSMVHFWSLAVEWHFYIIFPLLVFIFDSIKKAALSLFFVALFSRILFFAVGLSDNATYSFSFCRFDSLAVGALIAACGMDSLGRKWKTPLLFGSVFFLMLMCGVYFSNGSFKSLPWLQMFGYTLISVSIGFVLIGILRAPENSLFVRVLELRWVSLIGRSSYSIYIWHLVFFPLIMAFSVRTFHGTGSQIFASTLIAAITTAVFSSLSYLFVEKKTLSRP